MSTTPVTVVARMKAKPGREEALREALLALIPPTRQEPGCLQYDLHESTETSGTFVFLENWRSKEELDTHLTRPHLKDFLARAEELLAEPPEITLWKRIG